MLSAVGSRSAALEERFTRGKSSYDSREVERGLAVIKRFARVSDVLDRIVFLFYFQIACGMNGFYIHDD
jgi:hypothetical protein